MYRKILIIVLLMVSPCKAENFENLGCVDEFLLNSNYSQSECAIQELKEVIKLDSNTKYIVALGNVYTKLGKYPKAKKYYKYAIQEGDNVDAMFNVAQIYYEEERGEGEFKNTITYLKKAAQHELAEAQLFLSYIYGNYLENKNHKLAMSYLQKAANNNEVDENGYITESVFKAQLALSKVYLDGMWEQEKDFKKGEYWLSKALNNRADKQYKVN